MSKDIRSFFTKLSTSRPDKEKKGNDGKGKEQNKSGSKRRANIADDDDEDVIPESPQIVHKDKINKRARVLSSSDEDLDNFQTKTKDSKLNNMSKQSIKTSSNHNKKSPTKQEFKKVNPSEFFGSGPVKRVIETSDNKDLKWKKSKTETGVHDDEKFDKTLMELDDTGSVETSQAGEIKINGNSKTPVKNSELSRTRSGSRTPQKLDVNIKDNNQRSTTKNERSSRSNSKTPIKNETKTKDVKESDRSGSSKSKNESNSRRSSSRTPKKDESKSSSKTLTEVPKLVVDESKKKQEKSKDKEINKASLSSSPYKRLRDNQTKARMSALGKKLAISDKAHGKKDFSVFINDETNEENLKNTAKDADSISPQKKERHDLDKTTTPKSESKKRKSHNSSVSELTDEERIERKRYSAMLYKNYLHRSGPKHHGAKEVPEGSPNCLAGLVFLVTGVLDSFEKEEIESIVRKYGGDFKKTLSKKVTHLIIGEDAGPKKIAEAEQHGTAMLSEDEFLQLIKDNTENKVTKNVADVKKEPASDKKTKQQPSPRNVVKKEERVNEIKKERGVKKEPGNSEVKSEFFEKGSVTVKGEKDVKMEVEVATPSKTDSSSSVASLPAGGDDLPWVEKYKPQSVKQIIGQQGENSNVKKLLKWLKEWYASRKKNLPKPNPWSGDKAGGGYYKAALLSGPPGVGKTTSVQLICKELGFDTVEFNASDTRSKTLLKEHLTDLVSSNSLAAYSHGKTGKGAITKKHVVVMDEVDGMAGNEDRGGMQELLALIKITSVPIICMCNDKTSPKMRSLSGNCYDLTFARPRVDQIKGAMLSVCFKEGVKIPPSALAQMITAANQDIRQVLNLLSVWSAVDKNLSSEGVDKDSKRAEKDMKLGPWEVVRKVFSQEDHKKMSIHDKSALFFHDYSLGPLFVHQNYLKVVPKCDKKDVMSRFAEAADCLSLGDTVESKIRSNMAWSLLPLQAMFSSVMPGDLLAGHMGGQLDFPAWLGQYSKTNKMNRLAQELHSHTGLSTSGSKLAVRLDYAKHLRDAVIDPLVRDGADGVHKSIEILENYHLLREDLDSLLELTHWPGQRDPYSMVETKIKTALTRTYNKEAAPLPYSHVTMKKSKSTASSADSDVVSSETGTQELIEEEEVEENSDAEHDAMIKIKPSKTSSHSNGKKGSTSSKPSTSKESSKGKGKKK